MLPLWYMLGSCFIYLSALDDLLWFSLHGAVVLAWSLADWSTLHWECDLKLNMLNWWKLSGQKRLTTLEESCGRGGGGGGSGAQNKTVHKVSLPNTSVGMFPSRMSSRAESAIRSLEFLSFKFIPLEDIKEKIIAEIKASVGAHFTIDIWRARCQNSLNAA